MFASPESSWPEGSPQSQHPFFGEDGSDDPHNYYPRPAPQELQENCRQISNA